MMIRILRGRITLAAVVAALASCLGGCTSISEYWHNGLKVGPNYCTPPVPVGEHWIDQAQVNAQPNPAILACWWRVFNDPKLENLIQHAYRQNLSVREAAWRVIRARNTYAYYVGGLFPQSQNATGGYRRIATPAVPTPNYTDAWNSGFNLQWELDLWGRLRRQMIAAKDNWQASMEDYDGVVVTLLGDIAQNYVRLRTDQERIKLLKSNIELQRGVLKYVDTRLKAGYKQTDLDLNQAISNLRQTEAGIPALKIDARQAGDLLCILLGMPPVDLEPMLGIDPIPTAPPDVCIGIPADLLRRRPDVLEAERLAAAQSEAIGVATADFYPLFTLNGTIGALAQNFPDLFRPSSFNGSVGPSFQWQLLNYGRIISNVRIAEARFRELVLSYQQAVLTAQKEVEDGLVTFLESQRRTRLLDESVTAAKEAVRIVVIQYRAGAVDFNRYAVIEQNLVTQQDASASARGQIAQGLIQVYRALGGGWEIRLDGEGPVAAQPVNNPGQAENPPEPLPVPPPENPAAAAPAPPQPNP
jgi:NodT family efflux transporter outer membrane factor (OMF) lipoprotein